RPRRGRAPRRASASAARQPPRQPCPQGPPSATPFRPVSPSPPDRFLTRGHPGHVPGGCLRGPRAPFVTQGGLPMYLLRSLRRRQALRPRKGAFRPQVEPLEDRTVPAGPSVLDPNLAVRTVVAGLNQPTSMAFLGNNDFFVLEKATGKVQHVVNGAVAGTAIDLAVNNNSERGLLGIA